MLGRGLGASKPSALFFGPMEMTDDRDVLAHGVVAKDLGVSDQLAV